jgi:hypothetical protein
MAMPRVPLFGALALLAGCASAPPAAVAPPPPPGMDLLLGQPAETALALLGTPRLDRREGPARQLQFAGGCVLDLFYYGAPAPVATHADARLPDGRDYAAGDCLQQLLRARAAATPVAAPAAAKPPAKPAPRRRG